jgi:hypothetical protein
LATYVFPSCLNGNTCNTKSQGLIIKLGNTGWTSWLINRQSF